MRYTYCPQCGGKLGTRILGDEGAVPWCEPCARPWFDTFSTCVICAVINEQREVALIRQDGVKAQHLICVAGYMKPGESAEETAAREIAEEIGQTVEQLTYVRSYPMAERSLLMLGFAARVRKRELVLSCEVDEAEWVPFRQALGRIREGSVAWQLVREVIEMNERCEC